MLNNISAFPWRVRALPWQALSRIASQFYFWSSDCAGILSRVHDFAEMRLIDLEEKSRGWGDR
jgi:hypothetical protein